MYIYLFIDCIILSIYILNVALPLFSFLFSPHHLTPFCLSSPPPAPAVPALFYMCSIPSPWSPQTPCFPSLGPFSILLTITHSHSQKYTCIKKQKRGPADERKYVVFVFLCLAGFSLNILFFNSTHFPKTFIILLFCK